MRSIGNPLLVLVVIVLGRAVWRPRLAWNRFLSWERSLARRHRVLLWTVAAPAVVWLLLPPHLRSFVDFVENRSSVPSLLSAESVLFYPRAFAVELGNAASHLRADLHEGDVAIFGRTVTLGTRLRDGDRVELLRPLQCDPKQVRRERAARSANRHVDVAHDARLAAHDVDVGCDDGQTADGDFGITQSAASRSGESRARRHSAP